MREFKSVTIFIFILLSIFFIEGCKQDTGQGTKTAIHFVTWKPNIPEAWDEILKTFKEENPDIEIVREIGPHSSTAFHDMLTQKLKNRSEDVDVFLMDVIWPPEFGAAGWAMPLDELFPEEERKEFLEGTIIANTYGGHIYGIPLFIDSGMLFYRKDLLEKYRLPVPITWKQMVDTAEWIVREEKRQGNEIYGFTGQFKQYEGLVCDMMEYILSNGGYIIDPETGKIGLEEESTINAIKFVRDNIIGKIAPRGVLTYQEPESLDLFVQGKVVFHRNWPYAWEISNNPEKSKMAGKVGIARLPHFSGHESVSTLGGWQVGISSFTKNKEASWKFAKFLTSARVQKILALKAGRAPTRKILYEDSEILRSYPHFKEMKEVFLTAYPRPRTPLYPAVSNVLQRFFSRVISDPSLSIKKEAHSASEEIKKILSLQDEKK